MEEIRGAALAYFHAGTDEQKQLAWNFFNSMDADGDGRVDLREFISFLSLMGHGLFNNPSFFRLLDRDGNGSLDFYEVISLYYMIQSKRPFCDGCGVILMGLFFTCVGCHEHGSNTFDLCSACYGNKNHNHEHAAFLDNYALLAHKRLLALGPPNMSQTSLQSFNTSKAHLQQTSSWSSSALTANFQQINSRSPNFMQNKSKYEKVMQALVALEGVASIGTTAAAVAITAGACSIL